MTKTRSPTPSDKLDLISSVDNYVKDHKCSKQQACKDLKIKYWKYNSYKKDVKIPVLTPMNVTITLSGEAYDAAVKKAKNCCVEPDMIVQIMANNALLSL
jgi:hypothetical protein